MIGEVGYLAAILAGMISFVTPCVLPLVPPYLCYMAGVSADNLLSRDEDTARMSVLAPAFAFVLGFGTIFTLLGAGASTLGGVLRAYGDILAIGAGLIIIAMGLHFLGILRIPLLFREVRFRAGGAGLAGSFLMGLAFAFGWTPCIGPVLGTILAVAGTGETAGQGAALLAAYSAGLGLPFLVAAAFAGRFMQFAARMRAHLGNIEKGIGILLVITGLLFLTGGMQSFSFWLLEMFPGLGTLG